ncbi:LacI family DNA-binding transcriptional regulator [Microbacterium capsulatum]|uniref:LacI family DNA-binding transcriptional regulator n=1 Tax=Microbacterium capsulatum TaxID=3041921 RepID=A0ABU0XKT5_9MICO|nr:LacI family DNA-binding transcriptional regulator [Microbacterium sp. ASV81]MDQ4215178.1 LacI family DNA-binding transcriptional regulator [Microbacterium sp. ASV81]
MVSISDVARHAGVSPTTVSHALSGKRRVSDELRDKVLNAMAELDYVPTRAAQNLALGRSGILAIIVPDIAIEYFAELAKSVEREAVERGYNLMLATTGFDAEREARYLEMIASRAVDGIVYASGASLGITARASLSHGLPVVMVDEELEGVELRTVISDNEEGGRLVAEHLLALGHRRVLEIQGAPLPVTSVNRSRGFAQPWIAAGGEIVTTSGDYTADGGRAAVERYLPEMRERGMTAVFAHNDLMALGALDALRSHGIGVPDEVSVVGFDDMSSGHYSVPRLTTVRQDVDALGRLAAQAVLDAVEAKEPIAPERTVLPVTLIVRSSTAEAVR